MTTNSNSLFVSHKGKDKWERVRKAFLEEYRDLELKVITNKWIAFLRKDKKLVKNSFIIWNLGNRGSGKTAELFKIVNIVLRDNPKRFVQFWRATEDVIKKIESVCPLEYIGRFENITKLRDIKPNGILVLDEGLLGINAKEALKKEMRNFIKFLSKSRHYNIIVIINSISYNILLDVRSIVDILIYRRLPRIFIKQHSSKDVFLKDFSKEIVKLKDWEGIMVSTYKRFETTGKISWKYEDYCPWFNDKISLYQESTNPDVVFDEHKKEVDNNTQVVEWIISQVKDKFIGKRGFQNLTMWLYSEYPEIYTDNERNLKTIYNLYCYYHSEGIFVGDNLFYELPESADNSKYNSLMKRLEEKAATFNFNIIEEEALKLYKNKNKHKETIDRNIEIFKLRHKKTVEELATEYKISKDRVYKMLLTMRGRYAHSARDFVIGTINYYKGKLFEKVYGKFLTKSKLFDNVVIDGAPGKPDIVCYKDEMIIVFSCKNINISVSHLNAPALAPEIKACKIDFKNVEKRYLVIALFENDLNKLYHYAYDYDRPTNINIKKYLKKLKYEV